MKFDPEKLKAEAQNKGNENKTFLARLKKKNQKIWMIIHMKPITRCLMKWTASPVPIAVNLLAPLLLIATLIA